MDTRADLRDLLKADVVRVEVRDVRGSTPREVGAFMLVSRDGMFGTIGGGQLEYMAIDEARKLLKKGDAAAQMDVPLGPEIGQCCGGRVGLSLKRLDDGEKARTLADEESRFNALPHVYVFGAGHVGRALADQFALMPVRCILIDSREEELNQSTANVEKRLSALPEADVRAAPAGSAFIMLTHDHALDFLLTAEALAQQDAAWVGMIGSATKRASFESYARRNCAGLATDALHCPIGANRSADKRPAIIAAFAVSDVLAALTREPAKDTRTTTAP